MPLLENLLTTVTLYVTTPSKKQRVAARVILALRDLLRVWNKNLPLSLSLCMGTAGRYLAHDVLLAPVTSR